MIFIFAFLFGLIFGSFANVILLRFNTGESIVFSGSRCFSCSQKLKWFELVPIISFLVLRGRCRSCKSRISFQYPFVELGTGILFLLLFWHFDFGIDLSFGFWHLALRNSLLATNYVLLAAAWLSLWVAALYDFRHKILPDRLLIISFLSAIAALALNYTLHAAHYSLVDSMYQFGAGAGAFLFFFLLWFISKGRWMGLGDAKLAFVFAPLLAPIDLFIGLILSFFLGSIVGIALLIVRRAGWKSQIPFGPFLFLGAFLSFMWGERILEWYMGLFL